jgi:hypothetical protein
MRHIRFGLPSCGCSKLAKPSQHCNKNFRKSFRHKSRISVIRLPFSTLAQEYAEFQLCPIDWLSHTVPGNLLSHPN